MTGLATFIQASAHSLPMLADGSVQMIATSPPYYGLRAYAGEQGIEWPAVTYRLNEWCEPVTVPGCDPNCEHEWTDGPRRTQQPQRDHGANGDFGNGRGAEASRQGMSFTVTQGSYCSRCGGWRGGLGMEPNPVAYIGHLILCLREWRRVLRDDGTAWINLGDSYHGGKGASSQAWSGSHQDRKTLAKAQHHVSGKGETRPQDRRDGPIAAKNLLGIPWMFALAARADGWYLRSAIVWAKGVSFDPDYSGSVMPGSQQDRPTSAYENIFLLTKRPRYYYDNEAVKEAGTIAPDTVIATRGDRTRALQQGRQPSGNEKVGMSWTTTGTRTLRNVWVVNPSPFKGAHFACWPEKLVEPMIKAGSRPGDVVLDPFSGSGTTAKVAVRLGRRAIGVDVSAEYLEGVTAQRFGAGVQMEMTV